MSPAAKSDDPAPQRSAGKSRESKRFEIAIRRQTVTIALRATVIPMLLAAVVLLLWLLFSDAAPAQIVISGMH